MSQEKNFTKDFRKIPVFTLDTGGIKGVIKIRKILTNMLKITSLPFLSAYISITEHIKLNRAQK
jgi:hypothetical protein